jgi:hypothetical protein
MKKSHIKIAITFILIFLIAVIGKISLSKYDNASNREAIRATIAPPVANEELKKIFNQIYDKKGWGEAGGGSGPGSTLEYTTTTRNIIYTIVQKYKINSILDAPCGAMAWMPDILKNLSSSSANFKYHGVDLVEEVINKTREKYSNDFKNWKFSVLDVTRGHLPADYDLIVSRDALQHLPLINIYEAIKSYAAAETNSRYLLVGGYMQSRKNSNTQVGGYFDINLTLPPFNLNKYVEIFREAETNAQKYLILYDIRNYLRNLDFEKIKTDISSFV